MIKITVSQFLQAREALQKLAQFTFKILTAVRVAKLVRSYDAVAPVVQQRYEALFREHRSAVVKPQAEVKPQADKLESCGDLTRADADKLVSLVSAEAEAEADAEAEAKLRPSLNQAIEKLNAEELELDCNVVELSATEDLELPGLKPVDIIRLQGLVRFPEA